MTLDQLRIFVEVAERQHLTQAAAALALTPSAVSSSIKALEERYGTTLFDRVGRRIETNEAGRIFLAEARRTLASARAAELTLAELGSLQRGSLAIHASQTIASYWLPPLLVRFRQTYPAIALALVVANTENVAAAVVQGEADLGFVEGELEEGGLEAVPVGEDRMVVVVGTGHPWADGRPLDREQLLGARWIMREAGSGTRSAFESALAALGVPAQALAVALALPSNEAVRSAVMAGAYAGALSELVVASDLHAGVLAQANLALPARRFSMLRHPERHRSRAAAAFADLVRGPAA
ncbi:LysR family transcriptional regulator [Massilia sp. WF1]|uniref:LysR substrate-binding domain-containing protein n=1 Tax=unclassified Massilia TaxID=2609279 RepID=UPI00068E6C12|nr:MULTISPECIES: LysR substrate-binding domain-containing protein [unclassified Massilia]ALK99376.1 LysR family transcriptional regulator [Massilia sp. WG5]KNZ67937.1 LysR family transcriptional regulator [Massilia sp. WF1]